MPKANDKDVYYFSHDCNARNDEKILALRSVYGLEGYAIYFMIIEILREQPTYKLPVTKYTFNTLAMQMQCDCNSVEKVINDCCNEFKNREGSLLKIEGDFLYSESLLRRMEKVDNTSESRRQSALSRWNKKETCKSNANAEQKECYKKRIDKIKLDEIKLDKTKLKETKRDKNIMVVPTLEQIQSYCIERKNNVDPQKFYDYFTISNWIDSKGNKVKNWKQKIITWENQNQNNAKQIGTEIIDKMLLEAENE